LLCGGKEDPEQIVRIQSEANAFVGCANLKVAMIDQLKEMSVYLDDRLAEAEHSHA
jgi:hypothetical protein